MKVDPYDVLDPEELVEYLRSRTSCVCEGLPREDCPRHGEEV